jgi:hypothetical protein
MSLAESAKQQALEFMDTMRSAGNEQFGFDRKSVAHVDGFVERMSKSARRNEQRRAHLVSFVGSYLGEAILAAYGGKWVELDGGLVIHIEHGERISMLQPYGKVHDRIMNGDEDNLEFYFAEFIPKTLSGEAPPEWSMGERPVEPNKPWWKVW